MNIVIITAAGYGRRMRSLKAKQYLEMAGYPVLYYTLRVFFNNIGIDKIILVVPKDDIDYVREEIVNNYNFNYKIMAILAGGKERQDSIYNALSFLDLNHTTGGSKILIHDGVRPFISSDLIQKCLEKINKDQGVVVGVRVKDTIKRLDKHNFYQETLNRKELVAVQTPQGFLFETIITAYKKAFADDFYSTDDAALVEKYNLANLKMVEGDYFNLKITTPEDLIFGRAILESKSI